MTPSVPGKAYFIAENQRQSAASSSSVNSYPVGEHAASVADRMPRTVSGKGTTFVCSDTLSPRPRIRPHGRSHTPPNVGCASVDRHAATPVLEREPERRACADYLSIQDRYRTRAEFDSENTIRRRFRVNRAYGDCVAFQTTVVERQQWQKGDSC